MSDRTGRKPKGTMVRPAPDWFSDYFYVGGMRNVYNPASVNNYVTVALLNNDQQGRVLKVYGVTMSCDGGEGFDFWFIKGTIGAQVAGPYNIRPDYPAPPAQTWFQTQAAAPANAPNPFLPANTIASLMSDGFDGSNIFSPFPLFIVPQGYSLVGSNDVGGAAVGCFFWFQISDN